MTELDAAQELAFIKKVMEDSRRIVRDDGMDYLVWGILVVIGLALTYLAVTEGVTLNIGWVWGIVVSAGWIFSIATHWKKESHAKVHTLAGTMLMAVWVANGISMTILGFAGPASGAYKSVFISPIMATVLGAAYFSSSFIYGNTMIRLLSLGWWLGALVMFFWPGLYTLLLFALMIILFQILPGLFIFRKYKAVFADETA